MESAHYAIKKSMLGRRVLRARTLPGIAQEIYTLLTVYQAIRIAIADATVPGTDPDRASFSIALQTARDQIIRAADVVADTAIDLVGAISRAVLDNRMPARRLRVSPHAVKQPLSRYPYKSLHVDRRTYKATISIDILLTGPLSPQLHSLAQKPRGKGGKRSWTTGTSSRNWPTHTSCVPRRRLPSPARR